MRVIIGARVKFVYIGCFRQVSVCFWFLKKEQDIAVKNLLMNCDVLVVLPTGYGKSLVHFQTYVMAHKLQNNRNACVICLLTSIIQDQIAKARSLEIT